MTVLNDFRICTPLIAGTRSICRGSDRNHQCIFLHDPLIGLLPTRALLDFRSMITLGVKPKTKPQSRITGSPGIIVDDHIQGEAYSLIVALPINV